MWGWFLAPPPTRLEDHASGMLASPRGRFREACGSHGGILAVVVKQGDLLLASRLLSARRSLLGSAWHYQDNEPQQ